MNSRVPRANTVKQDKARSELMEGLEAELHPDIAGDELDMLVSRLVRMPKILPDECFVEEVLAQWHHNNATAIPRVPDAAFSMPDDIHTAPNNIPPVQDNMPPAPETACRIPGAVFHAPNAIPQAQDGISTAQHGVSTPPTAPGFGFALPVLPASLNFRRTIHKMNIWEKLKVVISHGDFAFLWYGLVFYAAGFVLLQNSANFPEIFILPAIAAIPFLIGVISTVRWFEHGLLELMMSLKLKLAWYMNARFFIIGIYSLILNTILTFMLSGRGINWNRLALYWLIPCIFVSSIAMWLCAWVRSFRSLVCCYVLLPLLCMLFYGEHSIQRSLQETDVAFLGVALAAMLAFLVVTVFATTFHVRNGGMVLGTRT